MMKLVLAAVALFGLIGSATAETLTVGAYPANPPWEVKQEDGSFVGFEVDLVNAIADKLGMDAEFQDLGFQALFAATSSGRIDLAISTITITDERLQNQDFTQGYYDADMAMGVREGSGVTALEDLDGQDVGVLSASTGEKWALANKETYGIANVRGYDAYTQMLLDAQNGRVAAVITDLPGMLFAFKNMNGMAAGEIIPTGDRYGIMLGKGSDLTGPINDAISALKEEGVLAKIHETHFGVSPTPGSSTVTVLDLPSAQ